MRSLRKDSRTTRQLAMVLIAASVGSFSSARSTVVDLAMDTASVASRVDRAIEALPENAYVVYAPPIDDAAFLRRASLDLLGVIPTLEELNDFRTKAEPHKRARLVERLTANERFGRHLGRYWRDAILARRLEERALRIAEPLADDLAKWINQGQGWDQIATRFITAKGRSNEDGSIGLVVAQDGRTEEIAAEVSRLFLGVQIQCAQCHDHPWDRWKREQFHELAAFFPRVGARPVRGERPPVFEVVVNDRPDKPRFRRAKNANRRGRPEHYMADLERPEEPGRRMTPRFFLTGFEQSPGTKDATRRGQLAAQIVGNEWFARSIVNRVWTDLIGEGFYDRVDDLGPDRTPVAEEALEALVEGFVASGYKLDWLYRTVTLTEAYARQSRPADRQDAGVMTATLASPLQAEVLLDSLLLVLSPGNPIQDPTKQPEAKARKQFRRRALRAVEEAFGFDPSDPREEVVGTIPQSLLLMNSPALGQRLRARPGSFLSRLLASHTAADGSVDHPAAIDELFERTLSRGPSREEQDAVLTHLSATSRKAAAYEDTLWAVLNTAEFSHRR